MTSEDWAQLEEIHRLLKPMKEATIRLQGNAVNGVFGALWEVLPTMESLLNDLLDWIGLDWIYVQGQRLDSAREPPMGHEGRAKL